MFKWRFTSFFYLPITIIENRPALYKFCHFWEHNMWICSRLLLYFTWKMLIIATSWLFGKTEAELKGGGVRWRRGKRGSSPLPHPPSTSPLSPRCTGMAWERIPHPIARRHPATKYNTNSIKCSLRCDLPQWMINWSSFSHCRISEIAIIGRIVL